MFNFTYIKPSDYKAIPDNCDTRTLEELKALANAPDEECSNCDNRVWKLGGCGMCFACTTGEKDASEDYELLPEE